MLPAEPNLEVRSRLPPAARQRQRPQAAAAVRPRRLLRRLVLGAVLPALVRASAATPAHALSLRGHGASRRPRDAVRDGPRRLRRRRRARRRDAAVAAGADRPFDGRGDRRAAARRRVRSAPRRCCRPVPPAGPPADGRAARRRAARVPAAAVAVRPGAAVRHVLDALRPFYFSDDVAPEILAEATRAPLRRVAARAARPVAAAALAAAGAQRRARCSCWAPRATASRTPTTCARRRATTASRRRSCPGSRTC